MTPRQKSLSTVWGKPIQLAKAFLPGDQSELRKLQSNNDSWSEMPQILLPVVAFILFYLSLRKIGQEWRWAILGGVVFCGSCTVFITEALSIFRALSLRGVAISWLAICVFGLILLAGLGRHEGQRPQEVKQPNPTVLDGVSRALLMAVVFLVFIVGVTALVAPPNLWDAMEYHLPRVIMWTSNHSVQFYPTPDDAQLLRAPWAEYAMLHTYLLWGSDRFVNMVEFFSFIGSLVGVSLIAKCLGAGLRGQ